MKLRARMIGLCCLLGACGGTEEHLEVGSAGQAIVSPLLPPLPKLPPKSLCGNGVLEPPNEECEGEGPMADFGGASCASLFGWSGHLVCSQCKIIPGTCHGCGDNYVETGAGEQCDGSVPSHMDCGIMGFDGGQLACQNDCKLDTSGCTLCGNGVIDSGEACDGKNLGGKTCPFLGQMACRSDCTLDKSGCHQGFITDPAGYIRDRATGDPIAGATVTCWVLDSSNTWVIWPAAPYGQHNPLTTPATGFYSFYVPPGSYIIKVSAPGYYPAQSPVLDVETQAVWYDFSLKIKPPKIKLAPDWKGGLEA